MYVNYGYITNVDVNKIDNIFGITNSEQQLTTLYSGYKSKTMVHYISDTDMLGIPMTGISTRTSLTSIRTYSGEYWANGTTISTDNYYTLNGNTFSNKITEQGYTNSSTTTFTTTVPRYTLKRVAQHDKTHTLEYADAYRRFNYYQYKNSLTVYNTYCSINNQIIQTSTSTVLSNNLLSYNLYKNMDGNITRALYIPNNRYSITTSTHTFKEGYIANQFATFTNNTTQKSGTETLTYNPILSFNINTIDMNEIIGINNTATISYNKFFPEIVGKSVIQSTSNINVADTWINIKSSQYINNMNILFNTNLDYVSNSDILTNVINQSVKYTRYYHYYTSMPNMYRITYTVSSSEESDYNTTQYWRAPPITMHSINNNAYFLKDNNINEWYQNTFIPTFFEDYVDNLSAVDISVDINNQRLYYNSCTYSKTRTYIQSSTTVTETYSNYDLVRTRHCLDKVQVHNGNVICLPLSVFKNIDKDNCPLLYDESRYEGSFVQLIILLLHATCHLLLQSSDLQEISEEVLLGHLSYKYGIPYTAIQDDNPNNISYGCTADNLLLNLMVGMDFDENDSKIINNQFTDIDFEDYTSYCYPDGFEGFFDYD